MGATMSMGRILSKFPQEYECVADNLARQENKSIDSVSLVQMDKYERLMKTGNFRSTEETVLVGYKKFSEDCRYGGRKTTRQQIFEKRDYLEDNNDDEEENRTRRRTTVVYVERTTIKLRRVIIERKKAVTMRPTTITSTDSMERVFIVGNKVTGRKNVIF
jgi:hypothetical protein